MKIIGLNAVADTVRALRADYNGLAIYDKETQTIRFEGALKNSCCVSVKCSGGLKVIQENERIPTYRT